MKKNFNLSLIITGFLALLITSDGLCKTNLEAQILKRLETIEKSQKNINLNKIKFSGKMEFEFEYEKQKKSSTDWSLATLDFGADAEINEYITSSFVFTYNDEDKGIELDEGFLDIKGKENLPLYAKLGHFIVPFGVFNTKFISDPMSKETIETYEDAITFGFSNPNIDISSTFFNGAVNKNDQKDDDIDNYVLAACFSLPVINKSSISFGGSYISNILESGYFQEELGDTTNDFKAGYDIFLTASIMEKIFLDSEYIWTSEDISINGEKEKLSIFSFEFGFSPYESVETAFKYEAGKGTEIETRYGFVVSWAVLDKTSLSMEYLKSDPDSEKEESIDAVKAQLAVEF